MRKECKFCKKDVHLKRDKYVMIGTYSGKKVEEEGYFHWNCFNKHWENKVREQAQNIVKKMQNKIMPVAKNLIKQITRQQ
jgi:hypothetical protein|tara:strand:- start:3251 stop:3490 length:240 start_codon:yes stop_codon:yes gene_type:complete